MCSTLMGYEASQFECIRRTLWNELFTTYRYYILQLSVALSEGTIYQYGVSGPKKISQLKH